jgi:hypothetical protein
MPLSATTFAPAPVWLTRPAADGHPIRVVVEPLPNGKWDWTVWQDGRGRASRYGISAVRDAAIDAAEAADCDLAACVARWQR